MPYPGERKGAGDGRGRCGHQRDGKWEASLDEVLVGNREDWEDGAPLRALQAAARECPVHWSPEIEDYPEEEGFWSLTLADDVHAVSRDWQTFSSERGGFTALTHAICRWS